MAQKNVEQTYKKTAKKEYVFAVGRRREAVARVRLYSPMDTVKIAGGEYKKGDVVVNGKQMGMYFSFAGYKPHLKSFFDTTGALEKYMYSVKVTGGGIKGQMEAMIHGLARALDKVDANSYHTLLKEHGYLTRDPRTRERRKVGMGGKARRRKQSPKR